MHFLVFDLLRLGITCGPGWAQTYGSSTASASSAGSKGTTMPSDAQFLKLIGIVWSVDGGFAVV